MIVEEYIKKIITMDRDSNGYIQVPNIKDLSGEQRDFLFSIPEIYDAKSNKIKVSKYNLTNTEKCAILACRTGNKSINNYAAENIAHASCTILTGNFLQGTDEILEINGVWIFRDAAQDWFESAIKADAGIGEESFPKDAFPIKNIAISLIEHFGAV